MRVSVAVKGNVPHMISVAAGTSMYGECKQVHGAFLFKVSTSVLEGGYFTRLQTRKLRFKGI